MAARFTPKQGQYLAFIAQYMKLHRRAPAEADLVDYFRVTPPSVHQMILTLEKRRLIARVPGAPRSIKLLVPPEELPPLEDTASPKLNRGADRARFEVGDWVKLKGIPPWVEKLPLESQQVFEFCVGKAYRVDEIGDDGLLVLDVSWDIDGHFGGFMNDVRVEPELVVRAEPRAAELAHRAIAGVWRIVHMDDWTQDAVDLLVPGHFRFNERSRLGSFQFIAVQGGTDSVYSLREGRPLVEFSWLGEDDGDPKNGRGWAELAREGELVGHIFFQQGMDSGFRAQRHLGEEVRSSSPRRRRSRR